MNGVLSCFSKSFHGQATQRPSLVLYCGVLLELSYLASFHGLSKSHANCQLKYAILLLYSEFFVEGNQEDYLYLNLESENDVRF